MPSGLAAASRQARSALPAAPTRRVKTPETRVRRCRCRWRIELQDCSGCRTAGAPLPMSVAAGRGRAPQLPAAFGKQRLAAPCPALATAAVVISPLPAHAKGAAAQQPTAPAIRAAGHIRQRRCKYPERSLSAWIARRRASGLRPLPRSVANPMSPAQISIGPAAADRLAPAMGATFAVAWRRSCDRVAPVLRSGSGSFAIGRRPFSDLAAPVLRSLCDQIGWHQCCGPMAPVLRSGGTSVAVR